MLVVSSPFPGKIRVGVTCWPRVLVLPALRGVIGEEYVDPGTSVLVDLGGDSALFIKRAASEEW